MIYIYIHHMCRPSRRGMPQSSVYGIEIPSVIDPNRLEFKWE